MLAEVGGSQWLCPFQEWLNKSQKLWDQSGSKRISDQFTPGLTTKSEGKGARSKENVWFWTEGGERKEGKERKGIQR